MKHRPAAIVAVVIILMLIFCLTGCLKETNNEPGGDNLPEDTTTSHVEDSETEDTSKPAEGNTSNDDQNTSQEKTLDKSQGEASDKTPDKSQEKDSDKTPEKKDRSVPILTYHSISFEEGNTVRLPEEKFREQMQWLKDNGYSTINLDDLHSHYFNGTPLPEKPVIITFDDGYTDNYEKAFPILKEFGFTATIYIITNTIDKSYGYLTSAQIKEMDAYGITMGSHTNKHEELDKLSYEAQLETIRQSRETLEGILGKKVRHFAYPVGLYNENTLKALRQEGFVTAVTMNRGWAQKNNGPLTLSRVFISSQFGMETFRERVTNPDYPVVFG